MFWPQVASFPASHIEIYSLYTLTGCHKHRTICPQRKMFSKQNFLLWEETNYDYIICVLGSIKSFISTFAICYNGHFKTHHILLNFNAWYFYSHQYGTEEKMILFKNIKWKVCKYFLSTYKASFLHGDWCKTQLLCNVLVFRQNLNILNLWGLLKDLIDYWLYENNNCC